MPAEISAKLEKIRRRLAEEKLDAVRFRGVDWFAWATGGGDSCVIFSSEAGIADVLVTRDDACVLTNAIESPRLKAEEIPEELRIESFPWARPEELERYVSSKARKIASDRPAHGELPLGFGWKDLKWNLAPEEVERYRLLGKDAAAAASTEALARAAPAWSEWQLAGAAAEALWKRGIHPLLTLVAGEERIQIHRHPTASSARLNGHGMLVICGRRHGLFANFTRHVFFRRPSGSELTAASDVASVEAEAFRCTREGLDLHSTYGRLQARYESLGHRHEIDLHHQGGPCGYLSREAVARPGLDGWAKPGGPAAYAWNPSLPGAKIEDTVLRRPDGTLEVLTVDPAWPSFECEGLVRPDLWVRA